MTTPLVLVHGFMGGSAQWAPVRAALAARFELIEVDLPGFGANADLPPIDRIEGFADWVIGELTRMGVARYHLLGHSMGGMIVQEIARKDAARIDKLVLYATGSIGVMPGRFETIAQSKARAEVEGAEPTARRIAATWFLHFEAAQHYPACADLAARATLPAMLAGLDAMEGWSGEAALGDIAADTLVLWGDGDRTYAWAQTERLWSRIPNAKLAVVPGCAHAVHMEKPDLCAALILDHLAGDAA